MKFFTVELSRKRKLLFSPQGQETLYDLSEAMKLLDAGTDSANGQNCCGSVADMNDLICAGMQDLILKLNEVFPQLKPVKREAVKILAPIVEPRQDIVCLGINYMEHAAEAKKFSDKDFGGEREKTIYFSKRAATVSGPDADIPSYPELVTGLDYEVELAVILGADARNVKAEEADDYIFGYSVFNDVSARNLQTQHKQWYFGKSLDGHSVMGPCIVTKDEIEDVYDLSIKCYVNGELRQNSNTGLMIQKIGKTIEELSKGMTLRAGTIIATGTPSGVGMGFVPPRFLKKGDIVRCEIEKIGALVNTVC